MSEILELSACSFCGINDRMQPDVRLIANPGNFQRKQLYLRTVRDHMCEAFQRSVQMATASCRHILRPIDSRNTHCR